MSQRRNSPESHKWNALFPISHYRESRIIKYILILLGSYFNNLNLVYFIFLLVLQYVTCLASIDCLSVLSAYRHAFNKLSINFNDQC